MRTEKEIEEKIKELENRMDPNDMFDSGVMTTLQWVLGNIEEIY